MQRMLTGLVLLLLIAVLVLALYVSSLSDRVDAATARQSTASRPVASYPDPEAAAREAERDRRLSQIQSELATLRREVKERPQTTVLPPPDDGEGGGAGEGGNEPVYTPPGQRPRDANGEFVITEEELAYFNELQQRAAREQRIDGTIRGVMIRIDRLVSRGAIQALPDDRRREIEKVLRKYVTAQDDLSQRVIRSPVDEMRDLTPEQRRDELTTGRTQLAAAAQAELEPIVGVGEAQAITEEALQRPWGLMRGSRALGNR
jgi:hypothetical protein